MVTNCFLNVVIFSTTLFQLYTSCRYFKCCNLSVIAIYYNSALLLFFSLSASFLLFCYKFRKLWWLSGLNNLYTYYILYTVFYFSILLILFSILYFLCYTHSMLLCVTLYLSDIWNQVYMLGNWTSAFSLHFTGTFLSMMCVFLLNAVLRYTSL